MKIGFLDSGIGGLTVLNEAVKLMPKEKYIYYADSKNAPYGTKDKNEVKELIESAMDFIYSKGVDAIVIACNTATSVSVKDMRNKYKIPIVGMEPAVKPAVERTAHTEKRVLVTATPLTIKEEKLHNLIRRVDNEGCVDLLPLPGLVDFAEGFEFREEVVLPYLVEELAKFNMDMYGAIVLGCTHFPIYKAMFRKILPMEVEVLDGNFGTVKQLKNVLMDKGELGREEFEVSYYISGDEVRDRETLAKYNRLFEYINK